MAKSPVVAGMRSRRVHPRDRGAPTTDSVNGTPRRPTQQNGDSKEKAKSIAGSIVDLPFILALVLGGCCANVWSYEQILKFDPRMGTALTFSQMCFITLTSLPNFMIWPTKSSLPTLKPRQVPMQTWAMQVALFVSNSLLNNWTFAYNVPITVQIVFRSAGLAVSMIFGYLFLKKRYRFPQIAAVVFVSAGVILATLSRPSAMRSSEESAHGMSRYTTGICMLVTSLFLTGALGTFQEVTYKKYGPHWQEGVFYTHLLSLPVFLFLLQDVKQGYRALSSSSSSLGEGASVLQSAAPYLVLAANLITQLGCVSGVNQLTSRVSSVTTNLVLTARKALSLCFSVWWFGSGWNAQLGLGAAMVFTGSLLYTFVSSS